MSQLQGYSHFKHFNVSSPSEFVAHVEINRPKKLNAFIEEMWIELGQIFDKLSYDADVRAIVLTGAGDRAFTAGLDVQAASQSGPLTGQSTLDIARTATQHKRHVLDFQECISRVEKCEKRKSRPSRMSRCFITDQWTATIAVLHGISFGLAVDMSSCCDIRIASKDVKISIKEVDIGIAADIGTLSRLPKIVGSLSWVKELALSARIFGAEEALAFGLVSQVYENKTKSIEAAFHLAGLIASKSPVAVQGTKELLNHARDNTVADSMFSLDMCRINLN